MIKLIKTFLKNFQNISEYYNYLEYKTKNNENIGNTNEILIANYYILIKHKNNNLNNCRKINNKSLKNYYLIKSFLTKNNYNLSFNKLVEELNNHQSKTKKKFTYQELSNIYLIMSLIYIEKLNNICREEYHKLINKSDVKNIIKSHKKLNLNDFIPNNFDLFNNKNYIFEINKQIRNIKESIEIFKELNNYLKENQLSLKEIINEENQIEISTNLVMRNILNNLKNLLEYSKEELYEKVSETEKLLLKDEVYKNMNLETKKEYRKQLIKQAKKNKVSTEKYLKILKKSNSNHIGFSLFKSKSNINMYIYSSLLVVTSILLSLYFSKFFLNTKLISVLLFLIPIYFTVKLFINSIFSKLVLKRFTPQLDYSKEIPIDSSTMVVIPAIIKNKEDLKNLFDNLESYYILNKTANLYFTVLGDPESSQVEIEKNDNLIIKFGEEYAKKLNKKYNKDLFYFIYRRRIWNSLENHYSAYNGQKGAILQFNKILLKEKIDENKYFNLNMLHKHNLKIKYIVSLPQDIRLKSNTIKDLVATINHPLNLPVLNKNKTKVIKGYAIMQPKICTDITNNYKTSYSKIISKLKISLRSNPIFSNLYYNLFSESTSCKIGIYNLKIYQQLLESELSKNLTFTKEYLETDYLRCAYLSNIEVIDDHTHNFLSDSKNIYFKIKDDLHNFYYLFNKNKKSLNLKTKIKIVNQILQLFNSINIFIILLITIILKNNYILIVILMLIIFSTLILNRSYAKNNNDKYKHDIKNKISIYQIVLIISIIPYLTVLKILSFIKTLKELITKSKKKIIYPDFNTSKITNYIKLFIPNFVLSLILFGIFISIKNYLSLLIAIIFAISPIFIIKINKEKKQKNIKKEKINDIYEIAKRTWQFFEDKLTEENNYLLVENYSENETNKNPFTTPENIGFTLTSIISSYTLNSITLEKATFLIEKILSAIDSLEKWNGLLYSKYNQKTKKPASNIITSLSSGIFLSSLIITKEFLLKNDQSKIAHQCEEIIKQSNINKFYNKNEKFSKGYDVLNENLLEESFNEFSSEALLLSYLGIALENIDVSHWYKLERNMTKCFGNKGLLSKEGTAIEYFLPHIYFKNFPNTLLNETYKFAYLSQKKYLKKVAKNLPWGLSKSGYNDIANLSIIQEKSFQVPYLSIKEEKYNRIVISPYSSFMVMDLFPKEILRNFKQFQKLKLIGKYGFYEAYDYDYHSIVKSYFTNHQGLILASITNYLNSRVIQELFHNNIEIKANEFLLKEKNIKVTNNDIKLLKFKKHNYKENFQYKNKRIINNKKNFKEIAVLSNKNYSLIMDDAGNSFSKYRNIQLNRHREVFHSNYGIYLFIKDIKTNYVWSNTYSPFNIKPDKYEAILEEDKITYNRKDSKITTKTEITVCKDYNLEIRKITFKNNFETDKELELTTYTEPIISELYDDISNKYVNNMFITSEYDSENNYLLAKRKNLKNHNVNNFMFTKLFIENPLEKYSYETERSNFIGRNNTLSTALALENKLSNITGDNIDPILSIRNKIKIKAGEPSTIYLLIGYGRSKEQIREIVSNYSNKFILEQAFKEAKLMNTINNKNLNLTSENIKNFNMILNYIYQTTKIALTEERMNQLRKNALGQTALWKYGISGDRKIISLEINNENDINITYEILKAYEYFKSKSIFIDIIILINDSSKGFSSIKKEIEDELYRIDTLNNFYHTPGSVIILNKNHLTREEYNLIDIIPNLKLTVENDNNLSSILKNIQKNTFITNNNTFEIEENILKKSSEKLEYDNGYGGFKNNGKEYFIYNKNTPSPWSNVIANKKFGTIITNNGCGYTYAYNSREYKISSSTSENLLNQKSEGFKFNQKLFDPTTCTHGFGYSILSSETKDLVHSITEFVALEDTVKIYLLTIKNKQPQKVTTDIEFFINPVLGNIEEKTINYILSEFNDEDNFLNMRNVYSVNYNDINVFMTSSEQINKINYQETISKSININLSLEKEEEKIVAFILGSSQNDRENCELVKKYTNLVNCTKELKNVKLYWEKTLGKIQITTPDKSFNYVLNGWYLYQTIASRINAKASFYKTTDTYNYRNYLEDALNLVLIDEEYSKKQIIECAKHQFVNGDVLHWWNEKNHFGLRSRYKDDYLWLPFTVIHYLDITKDYSILDEKIPYTEGETLSEYEIEKGIIYNYSENKDSLLNHCIKSIELSMNSLGKNNLPLIGSGDCNEKMTKIGIKGKGESAYLGFFLYNIIEQFIKLLKKYDNKIDLNIYQEFNKKLKDSLNNKAWDKNQYIRAIFDNGDKLGSQENNECKIDLISQSFAIISNVATKEQVNKIISSVEEKLIDKENKIIKNLTPAFKNTLNRPGTIMYHPIDFGENGGQSTKFSSFYLLALLKTEDYDRAYQYFQMINPISRTESLEITNNYKIEPYVLSSNISVAKSHKGQGSFPWLTGATSWFYRIGIEEILGLHKKGDKLKISPKLPVSWNGFHLIYKYKKTTYKIEVIKGEKEKLELDGKEQISNSITLLDDTKTHNIKINIKK